jgi:ceramide glucosyltransferase
MRPDVGLVSSAPTGTRPDGAAAELECAFLNSYQARWQLTADAFGNGYAQGKTLFWRRSELERAGGIGVLAQATAEDIASSLLMRSLGRKVRLVNGLSPQPLGRRGLRQVWNRQVRWAQLRRKDLPGVFWFEPLSFNLLFFALAAAAFAAGALSATIAAGLVVATYAAEYLLAHRMGWTPSPRSLPGWIARDLALPVVWLLGVFTNHYEWRGNTVGIQSEEWTPAEVSSPAEGFADG